MDTRPSMREIGDAVGLASLSSVTHQLSQLEKLGYIRRDPRRPRAMEILLPLQLKGDAKLEVVEGQDSLKAANGMNVSELDHLGRHRHGVLLVGRHRRRRSDPGRPGRLRTFSPFPRPVGGSTANCS
ncbi:LexA repressor [Solibacillus isronensis B3W22]|uniref:LexA repressor n=1 Tax=Solibacillus isronensis B3W22 TaxID=1224748 RepID=K1LFS5_9BACL|nr:LexA repressor [Solibacillus isronensis B3W22]